MHKKQSRVKTERIVLSILLLTALATLQFAPGATGSEAEIYFTVLHTNDEESALLPHSPAVDFHPEKAEPTVGGFARLAYLVEELRAIREAAGESVVLLGAADYLGGSPYAWLSLAGEAPELALMHQIGYDVITIGNHEFDYGPEVLAAYLRAAGYPQATTTTAIVASNIEPPANHPLAAVGIEKTFILELENGLRLGFFGLLGEAAEGVIIAIDPIDITDPVEAAVSAVQILEDKGADVIIAISHSGVEEDRSLAAKVEGIDIIVGGHCHTALYEPIIVNNTIIVQAGALLRYLGVLELAYNPITGAMRLRNRDTGQPFLVAIDDGIPLDPAISALIDIYTGKLNAIIERMTGDRFTDVMDIVAISAFHLYRKPAYAETPFGNFIADAMRLIGEQKTGKRVDFAIQANGNIRGSVIPGYMPHSQNHISFFDLVSQVGLGTGTDKEPGYPLVSFYITGDEMRRALEISTLLSQVMDNAFFLQASGLRYTYDPGRAILFRVPIKNLPIPTYRSVLQAERFIGEGIQGNDPADYVPLLWGDETLYHVVADYYIASFIPMVGNFLPRLAVIPKDRFGNEISLEDSIIIYEEAELKVWQAVVEHAASFPALDGVYPQIPEYYAGPAGRINRVRTIPLLIWPALALLAIVAFFIFLLRRRRRGRAKIG